MDFLMSENDLSRDWHPSTPALLGVRLLPLS